MCPVCMIVMRSASDAASSERFGCCDDCAVMWAEPNAQRWHEGWRPDAGAVQVRVAFRVAMLRRRVDELIDRTFSVV